jgi:Alkaline phosphatase PhoX
MKRTDKSVNCKLIEFGCVTARLAAVVLLALADAEGHAAPFVTSVAPYAVTLSPEYRVLPILSAGDRVPLASDPTRLFQMIGVPDGLGAYKIGGEVVAFMNHEVAGTAINEPVIGDPSYLGAFVSKFVLNADAQVVSGELAYDVIVDPAGNEVPPARVDNATPRFVRFCSGTLAWLDAGFDRPIYFCGEENPAPGTFDGKGGLAVAIFDRKAYTLPHLGHFQHENIPVRPHPVPETVLVLLEDSAGPTAAPFTSQLYLYVGQKDFTPGAHPLARNGLVGGKYYVLKSTTPGMANEAAFQSGTIAVEWVELTGVASMNEAQLDAASVAVGAFAFVKTEDGAWSKRDKNEFFFNSTGDTTNTGVAGNHLGRTYRLNFNDDDITGPCTLSILYNADLVVAAGFDIALTPDNLDASKDYLMVCEDGTGFSRDVMAGKSRTGQIWRYDLQNNYEATAIVSLATPGRNGVTAGAGVWETSGIIDAEHLYGRNSWLFNVQAHPPTPAPAPRTTEDGQLLLLLPVK